MTMSPDYQPSGPSTGDLMQEFIRSVQSAFGEDIIVMWMPNIPSESAATDFLNELSFIESTASGPAAPPRRMRVHGIQSPQDFALGIAGDLHNVEVVEVYNQAKRAGYDYIDHGFGPKSKALLQQVNGG